MNPVLQLAASAQGFLADGGNSPSDVDPTTGKGPEWGEAAPVGLLVIVLLCVAVYFLVKSMNRNIKKVPASFARPDEHPTVDDGPVDSAPSDGPVGVAEGDGAGAGAPSGPSTATS